MNRFIRTELLLGPAAFARLQSKKITVVGVGAVGGYVVEGLVRGGILDLRIVDFDSFDPSNINRQIHALESTIGRTKVEVVAERCLQINPNCRVQPQPLFAREDSLEQILQPRPDFLIDAIDSLNPKTQLLYEAFQRQIPMISSMGAALRTDPACIRVGDLFKTSGCPLAKHLRRRLRRRGVDRGIPCVYSVEKVRFDYSQENESDRDQPESGEENQMGRRRNILGSMPTIPGIFGLTIANHALIELSRE